MKIWWHKTALVCSDILFRLWCVFIKISKRIFKKCWYSMLHNICPSFKKSLSSSVLNISLRNFFIISVTYDFQLLFREVKFHNSYGHFVKSENPVSNTQVFWKLLWEFVRIRSIQEGLSGLFEQDFAWQDFSGCIFLKSLTSLLSLIQH